MEQTIQKPKVSPARFAREVRQEASKVTWPTRRETMVTTGMVLVMVFLMSMFFLFADKLMAFFVRFVLTF